MTTSSAVVACAVGLWIATIIVVLWVSMGRGWDALSMVGIVAAVAVAAVAWEDYHGAEGGVSWGAAQTDRFDKLLFVFPSH